MKNEQHTGKIRLKPYNSNELLPYVISCKLGEIYTCPSGGVCVRGG